MVQWLKTPAAAAWVTAEAWVPGLIKWVKGSNTAAAVAL